MYRVLLAEDEPAALRYLRTLIETHFPEFSVVATASDGEEALVLAKRHRPELILTDVKMPRVDGIRFVKQLKSALPLTPVVIVSGYDDFEYVRQALDTGVVDYVLKPVTVQKMSEVLGRLTGILRRNRDAATLSTMKRLVSGGREAPGKSADVPEVRLAILRYGTPPSRSLHEWGIRSTDRCVDGWCSIRGRDGNEVIFVAGADRLDAGDFRSRCAAAVDEKTGAYHTLLHLPQVVPGERLADAVSALFEALDRSIVLGHSQVLDRPAHATVSSGIDHLDASRIEHAVINSDTDELQELIRERVAKWDADMVAAVHLVTATRRILETVEHAAVRGNPEVSVESAAEEIVARARSIRDFCESLLRVAVEVGHLAADRAEAKRQDALFSAICSYLESSYSRRHTVDSVRTHFRISASYLSRLFRDNASQSFTEFLRRLRIDAAKRLIQESPEMPMKSVARYVGFADPFYFSRVFRSATGESPTEYSRRCRPE